MKRKKQRYSDRLDESLGMRHRGPHKQSLKDRRHESEAMEKRDIAHAFGGDRSRVTEMDMDMAHNLRRAMHKKR